MSRQPPSSSPVPDLKWRAVGDRAVQEPAAAQASASEPGSPEAPFAHLFPPAQSPYPHAS